MYTYICRKGQTPLRSGAPRRGHADVGKWLHCTLSTPAGAYAYLFGPTGRLWQPAASCCYCAAATTALLMLYLPKMSLLRSDIQMYLK